MVNTDKFIWWIPKKNSTINDIEISIEASIRHINSDIYELQITNVYRIIEHGGTMFKETSSN